GSQTKLRLPNISKLSIAPRKKAIAAVTIQPSVSTTARRTTPSNVAASRLPSYNRNEGIRAARKTLDTSLPSGRKEKKPTNRETRSVAGRAPVLSVSTANSDQATFKGEGQEYSKGVQSEVL
ncbi:hypothetical protein M513_09556, partial [Trichuris suis]